MSGEIIWHNMLRYIANIGTLDMPNPNLAYSAPVSRI